MGAIETIENQSKGDVGGPPTFTCATRRRWAALDAFERSRETVAAVPKVPSVCLLLPITSRINPEVFHSSLIFSGF